MREPKKHVYYAAGLLVDKLPDGVELIPDDKLFTYPEYGKFNYLVALLQSFHRMHRDSSVSGRHPNLSYALPEEIFGEEITELLLAEKDRLHQLWARDFSCKKAYRVGTGHAFILASEGKEHLAEFEYVPLDLNDRVGQALLVYLKSLLVPPSAPSVVH